MKASDLFVKCLETEGIDVHLRRPGEENADFMMSLEDSRIDPLRPDPARAGRRLHGGGPRPAHRASRPSASARSAPAPPT